MGLLTKPAQFVASKLKPPRFWENKEWGKMTHKEKIWMWYKHQLLMVTQGAAEFATIQMPIQNGVLYGGIIFVVAQEINVALHLGLSIQNLLIYLVLTAAGFTILKFYVHWWVGNWKDQHDLITLETEFANKRNNFFREMRTSEARNRWKKIR